MFAEFWEASVGIAALPYDVDIPIMAKGEKKKTLRGKSFLSENVLLNTFWALLVQSLISS